MTLRKAAYRRWVSLRWRLRGVPRPGTVDFGDLRRVEPVSRNFGADRGRALDRQYIDGFLARHAADVRGRVLEVGEDLYTRRYGGERVVQSDVLHVAAGNPRATIVADLANAPQIQDRTFDCVVLTQTLHLIYDARAAVRTLWRILKPGGVLLLTVPGITPVPVNSQWGSTWYWAFTQLSVQRMLDEAFGETAVAVEVHGNVLAATAFLQGLAQEDLGRDDFSVVDPDYPVIIAARAVRRG